MNEHRILPAALAASALLMLAACGGDSAADGETAVTDAAGSGDAALVLEDGVVRSAESGMTGAFGTLVNTGDEEVTVVGASSDAAGFMELHEVVDSGGESVMREKAGGFVVAAGDSYVLEPGGDHFMLMELTGPVEAGETVAWTVELADGSEVTLSAPVRDLAAGDEEYVPGHGEATGHGTGEPTGHDMDGSDMGGSESGSSGDA